MESEPGPWGAIEPVPQTWKSGLWSLERRGDELAYLAFDGTILARSIRAVVRDRDWNTVPVEVLNVEPGDLQLAIGLHFEGFGGEFLGSLVASVEGDTLSVELELTSIRDFVRNRVGLVVLHPPTLAGTSLEVTHPDGTVELGAFPTEISPHQPAFDIARLGWTADGVAVGMRFAGAVFEMEDQRNWTDASYKTYSGPLALPFPVDVGAGERIAQGVVLHASRIASRAVATEALQVRLEPAGHALPSFGLSASTAPDPIPPAESVGDFLLVELETDQANWRPAWARAVREAAGRPLDVRIVAVTGRAVRDAVDEIAGAHVIRLAVFSRRTHVTEPELWNALVDAATAAHVTANLVGGTRANFTELNREIHRLPPGLPALTFSSTPQIHAREQAQLIESVPMQTLTARDAVRIAAGRPVHIGPVTLRPRFNAVATTPPVTEAPTLDDGYAAQHVPGATDPRQGSMGGAAWLVATASAFSIAGVDSLTFCETSGPRGLVDADGRSTAADAAFRAIARLSGRPALAAASALPSGLHVLAAGGDGDSRILFANLSARAITTTVTVGNSSAAITIAAYGVVEVALPARR